MEGGLIEYLYNVHAVEPLHSNEATSMLRNQAHMGTVIWPPHAWLHLNILIKTGGGGKKRSEAMPHPLPQQQLFLPISVLVPQWWLLLRCTKLLSVNEFLSLIYFPHLISWLPKVYPPVLRFHSIIGDNTHTMYLLWLCVFFVQVRACISECKQTHKPHQCTS